MSSMMVTSTKAKAARLGGRKVVIGGVPQGPPGFGSPVYLSRPA
jgi:hypothetical protein